MEVSCLSRLAIEIFKTLKSLNPDFMCTYFKKGSHFARRKNDLVIDNYMWSDQETWSDLTSQKLLIYVHHNEQN